MFNLEQSIAEWRQGMGSAGVKNPEILDELESHLRDEYARGVEAGETERQAFAVAAQKLGQPSALKHEFAKVGETKWLRLIKRKISEAFRPVSALSGFGPDAQCALALAREEAPRLKHGFVGTEHVLLGLLRLEDGAVPNLLERLGVDRDGVRSRIEKFVSGFPPSDVQGEAPYTPRVEKSFRLAAKEARALNAAVGAEHVFLGLAMEGDGVAGRVLKDLGLSPEAIRKEISAQIC